LWKKGKDMTRKKQFGELEDAILALFSQNNRPFSVKEIQKFLGDQNAYTTIMTVMSRLHAKGVLSRTKEGRSYLYFLKTPRKTLAFSTLKRKLKLTRLSEVFSFFLQETDGVREEELEEIEAMIQKYRRKREE
jgi:predicted transcriptional regulator